MTHYKKWIYAPPRLLDKKITHPHSPGTVYGKLSPGCVQKYYQIYVDNEIPKRRYRYFHEEKEYNENLRRTEGTVDVRPFELRPLYLNQRSKIDQTFVYCDN